MKGVPKKSLFIIILFAFLEVGNISDVMHIHICLMPQDQGQVNTSLCFVWQHQGNI